MLAKKTMSQRYTIDYYKSEIAKLKDANTNYKRELNINQGTEEQYKVRGDNQQKKIAALKKKIQILEKSLSQIVQDFEKEKEIVRF